MIPTHLFVHREPAFGEEHHHPVIYLDLDPEDLTQKHSDGEPIAESAILDREMGTTFLSLPVVHADSVSSTPYIVASWDSSIHDSIHINRVTPTTERVYMIVKAYIRLSHPAPVDLTLRKRICINVYKRQSLTEKLRRKINKTANVSNSYSHCE